MGKHFQIPHLKRCTKRAQRAVDASAISAENHALSNRARQRVVLFEETKARARFARRVGRAEVVLIDAVSGTDDDDDAREERA